MQNLQDFKDRSQPLIQAINRGFSVMTACQMDFTPSPEDLPIVARTLEKQLIASGITDSEKVQAKLEELGAVCEKWPSVAFIIKQLKPEPLHQSAMYRLTKHEERKKYTPEEVNNFRETLKKAKLMLVGEEKPVLSEEELLAQVKAVDGGAP